MFNVLKFVKGLFNPIHLDFNNSGNNKYFGFTSDEWKNDPFADTWDKLKNGNAQKRHDDTMAYNRELNNLIMQREDSAHQREIMDLRLAGQSPLGSNGAGAGAGAVIPETPYQGGIGNGPLEAITTILGIAKEAKSLQIQDKMANATIANLEAEATGKGIDNENKQRVYDDQHDSIVSTVEHLKSQDKLSDAQIQSLEQGTANAKTKGEILNAELERLNFDNATRKQVDNYYLYESDNAEWRRINGPYAPKPRLTAHQKEVYDSIMSDLAHYEDLQRKYKYYKEKNYFDGMTERMQKAIQGNNLWDGNSSFGDSLNEVGDILDSAKGFLHPRR